MPSALSWCHGGFRTALGALAACLLLAALPGSATAGYVESSLGRGALATEAIDAHRLLIYSLDADAELDLVTVRSTGDESKMELWFRLDLLPLFGGDVLFPALDEWVDNSILFSKGGFNWLIESSQVALASKGISKDDLEKVIAEALR